MVDNWKLALVYSVLLWAIQVAIKVYQMHKQELHFQMAVF